MRSVQELVIQARGTEGEDTAVCMYTVSAGLHCEWHLVHTCCITLQHVAGQLQIGPGCGEHVHLFQQICATPFKYGGFLCFLIS